MAEPVVGADDQWALTPDDHALVMNKHRANRLGFAILFAFFRDRGRFRHLDALLQLYGYDHVRCIVYKRKGFVMRRDIEDFYQPEVDGDNFSLAIRRAQESLDKKFGLTLLFHPRVYRFEETINLVRGMSLIGSGAAKGFYGTQLVFAPGKTGIVCHFLMETGSEDPEDRGDQSIIERIKIQGGGISATIPSSPDDLSLDNGPHGVVMHVAAVLRDVAIGNFGGNGIHICASIGAKPRGDASNWQVHNCQVNGCGGNGLFVHGLDASVGCVTGLVCQDNKGWGISDESLFGNTYIACTAEHNLLGGYRASGTISADKAFSTPVSRGSGSLFLGCHTELTLEDTKDLIEFPNAVIGGNLGSRSNTPKGDPVNSGMLFKTQGLGGRAEFPNGIAGGNRPYSKVKGDVYGMLGGSRFPDTALELRTESPEQEEGLPIRLSYSSETTGWWEWLWGGVHGAFLAFSTMEAVDVDKNGGMVWIPFGYYMGGAGMGKRVRVITGINPPTITGARPNIDKGIWQKGDRVLNVDPKPGDTVKGFAGWICTKDGDVDQPFGEWMGFGKIEALQ